MPGELGLTIAVVRHRCHARKTKREKRNAGMTMPKVAGKSREGPNRSPRGKFPIYSSPLPNTWEPIKRMNGIVAVAAMLRAALGVHEIRARRPLLLFLPSSLSLALSLSSDFPYSFLPSPPSLSRSTPSFRLSPNALFTPLLALSESKLSAGWPAVLP